MRNGDVMEGTRQEVAEQLQLFPEDQRFRLILLSIANVDNQDDSSSIAERFSGRTGRFSFEPADLSERTEELYNEALRKKFNLEKSE